jgi:hypothetical protein
MDIEFYSQYKLVRIYKDGNGNEMIRLSRIDGQFGYVTMAVECFIESTEGLEKIVEMKKQVLEATKTGKFDS